MRYYRIKLYSRNVYVTVIDRFNPIFYLYIDFKKKKIKLIKIRLSELQ